MRLPKFRNLLFAGAIAAALIRPAPLAAQQPLQFGNWALFEWFLAPGAVEGGGFSFQSTKSIRLRIVDGGFSGDLFSIFSNGSRIGSSSTVAGGVQTDAFDGETAWANGALSRFEFVLAPGSYTIALDVSQAGPIEWGEGFIRADEINTPTTVPEPSTVVLMASGLLAVGAAARRRHRAGSAR